MSKDIVTQDVGGAISVTDFKNTLASQSFTQKQAQKSTKIAERGYFPFLQMLQKASKIVENDPETNPPGSFTYKKSGRDQKPINLGTTFPALLLSIRGKAVLFKDKDVLAEYAVNRDGEIVESDLYDEYVNASLKRGMDNNFRSGLDLLFWIPEVNSFATYHANTPTSTGTIEDSVMCYVGDYIHFGSEIAKNKNDQTYFIPSATLMEADEWGPLEQPDKDMFTRNLHLFNHPKASSDVGEGEVKVKETSMER